MRQEITLGQLNDDVLNPMHRPGNLFYLLMLVLGTAGFWGFLNWYYQVLKGMGVAGVNHPVGWASYIGNFVFWVGIAHSGTLISAILYLVRARWRTSVSRSAEAMTIFAIATAGLFPLIHLGRFWVFYYILPYPSERQLWPNFQSPLVWDVCAVGTYFTVSLIFFYIGMVPDLASARDRFYRLVGPDKFKTRLYKILSLGWSGSSENWRHHQRAYLFFCALATPLVISVHSVVSWDFAMGVLPGWHTTIFAPYFVAGAIHSGLAMVLTLLIPLRKFLHLENLIKVEHFEAAALTMLVTTSVVGYAYIIEPFMAWYSGNIFERQFSSWRAMSGWPIIFWSLGFLNVIAPLFFTMKKFRTSLKWLLIISIMVNLGMWLERLMIVTASTQHDFLSHNWGFYKMTWVEKDILLGSFGFFLFWFVGFSRVFPTVAISDVKKEMIESEQNISVEFGSVAYSQINRNSDHGIMATYSTPGALVYAVSVLKNTTFSRFETYTPARVKEIEKLTGRGRSPVRRWCLIGAILGAVGGFALAIGSALVQGLIVGGKHPIQIVPYCIVAFEGTILLGTIGNLIGMLIYSKLGYSRMPANYGRYFTRDKYGLYIECRPDEVDAVRRILKTSDPEAIDVCQ